MSSVGRHQSFQQVQQNEKCVSDKTNDKITRRSGDIITERPRREVGWMFGSTTHLTLTWETAVCFLFPAVSWCCPDPWPWAYFYNHDDKSPLTFIHFNPNSKQKSKAAFVFVVFLFSYLLISVLFLYLLTNCSLQTLWDEAHNSICPIRLKVRSNLS